MMGIISKFDYTLNTNSPSDKINTSIVNDLREVFANTVCPFFFFFFLVCTILNLQDTNAVFLISGATIFKDLTTMFKSYSQI